MLIQRSFVVILGLATLLGCKVDNDLSEQKTLEDFATGTSSAQGNSCGDISSPKNSLTPRMSVDPASINNSLASSEKLTQETLNTYRDQIEQYFAGVPQWAADYFVNKLNAEIMLANPARFAMLCPESQGLSEQRQSILSTCYAYETSGPNQARLAIVHRIDPAESEAVNKLRIRSGGVRAVGLLFAQFLSRQKADNDIANRGVNTKAFDYDVDPQVAAHKKELTARFLADVVKSESYSLDTFRPLLGKNLGDQAWEDRRGLIGSGAMQVAAVIDAGKSPAGAEILMNAGISKDDAQQFMDYVYAEAFDSAYCSDATMASAQKNFPRTMGNASSGIFDQLFASLQQHADPLADHFMGASYAQNSSAIGNTSFGLQSAQGSCPCCNGNCAAGQCNCTSCTQNNGSSTCAGGSCGCVNCQNNSVSAAQSALASRVSSVDWNQISQAVAAQMQNFQQTSRSYNLAAFSQTPASDVSFSTLSLSQILDQARAGTY